MVLSEMNEREEVWRGVYARGRKGAGRYKQAIWLNTFPAIIHIFFTSTGTKVISPTVSHNISGLAMKLKYYVL